MTRGKKKPRSQLPGCAVHFPFETKVVFGHFREMWNVFIFEKQLILREEDCQAVNQTMVLALWLTFPIVYAARTIFPRSSVIQQIRLCTSLCRSGPLGDVIVSTKVGTVSRIPFITPVSIMVPWAQNNHWQDGYRQASQEVLEMSSIKPKASPISLPRRARVLPWGKAWKNGFQGLTSLQPGFSLPSSHYVYQLLRPALSHSALLKPPSPFWLFKGVSEEHLLLSTVPSARVLSEDYSFLVT